LSSSRGSGLEAAAAAVAVDKHGLLLRLFLVVDGELFLLLENIHNSARQLCCVYCSLAIGRLHQQILKHDRLGMDLHSSFFIIDIGN
jgi:hypothetical protein